ncbi:MAG: serine/threonine protein kinase [Micrococcaceae bacterium]|nr:serine/threonine protein kinase [Micrococcaceae bacterium]
MKDWALEHELGRGSSGTVYVVRQRHTGVRAALKVAAAQDGGEEGSCSKEVQALASMSHEHIVELIGAVPTDHGEGILMEYLPGGSVADLIAARGPLTLGETVTVLAPVAGAVAFLHGNGAVHGDIAPGNVLFTAAGKPKLGDLGLAVLVGGRQDESGTPGFRAPSSEPEESGGRRLRPARDVYSLAALAWYMVTGRVAGPTHQRPPLSSLLGGVPTELVELLESGLAEDEEERPGAEEFGRRIFRIATPEPVNLREAVRPEALGQMVTHVVADPATRRVGRGPREWFRGLATLGRGRKRHPGSGAAGPRGIGRPARRGRGDRHRQPDRARGRARRGRRWAVIPAIGVLLCLVVAGLMVATRGGWGPQPAPVAHPATEAGPDVSRPAHEQDGTDAEASEGGDASQPPSVPPEKVLEASVFSTPVPEDPLQAARALTERRDLALAGADADALRQVHAGGGDSLGPDLAVTSQLRSRGLHYRGLKTRLSDVRINPGTDEEQVAVAATSTMSSYQVVGADGATIQSTPGPEVQDIILTLERVHGGWLIVSVEDASRGTGNHG